ncbi:glycine zipper domain-containing protein [Allochromatium vinosum]|uniref:17 kDa surface antigen n=1 Tax=Allochromatium vinosum (strain ATCC 17899 / DSM 180 / NBRC 103801 / NCIMB 10441 / D) TaxID=572477 RepID=D3RPV0_ALLVD|nr:glycine zipper domain-containing protein [Allochromatium vinosum]ADC63561.1 17 kDa surface antigen [Allochromatium vinosum DSM 180]
MTQSTPSSTRILPWLLSAALVTGCANIQDDQKRTQAEGAAAGAVLGALVGYAIDRERGAAIGALIGGGAGFVVGNEIAKRKKAYANTEDFLNAQIARVAEFNRTTLAYNDKLHREIASLDRESKRLQAQYKSGAVKKQTLVSKRNALNEKIAGSKKLEQTLVQEQQVQSQILADERKTRPANDPYIRKLEHEVKTLQGNIDTLRSNNTQLAQIDPRLSV